MSSYRYCGLVFSLLAVTALLVGACGGGNVSQGDVPGWFLNPPDDDDKIYGTGASEPMPSVQSCRLSLST